MHAFTRQEGVWAPHDEDAQALHDDGQTQLAALFAPAPPAEGEAMPARPALNASTDVWRQYLSWPGFGHDVDDLAGLGRAELIALAGDGQE